MTSYATAPQPFILDHLVFVPEVVESETAFHMDGDFVGEFELDETHPGFFRARKFNFFGGFDDWRPMRSAAEARAYLVSSRRL